MKTLGASGFRLEKLKSGGIDKKVGQLQFQIGDCRFDEERNSLPFLEGLSALNPSWLGSIKFIQFPHPLIDRCGIS